MRVVILERNRMVNRRIARYFTAAGMEAICVEDPADLATHVDTADLLAADTFDGDLVVATCKARPRLRALLWTAEPLKHTLRHAASMPQLSNVMGRKDFESTPRNWEMVMVARRLLRPEEPGPPFSSFLDWGFTGFQDKIGTTEQRDAVVEKVQRFINNLGVPKRISEMFGELTHEMLMNGMFDAPADADGRAKYALDRKAQLSLPEPEQPLVRVATDGTRLAIQVRDPFGRLQRKHVFDGLARGLAGGEMDTSHGGAGLGMVVCHNNTAALFFDVVPGKHTEVTGVFELDLNLREFRTQAKSLHYFQASADPAQAR
jgi:hypothetical protein